MVSSHVSCLVLNRDHSLSNNDVCSNCINEQQQHDHCILEEEGSICSYCSIDEHHHPSLWQDDLKKSSAANNNSTTSSTCSNVYHHQQQHHHSKKKPTKLDFIHNNNAIMPNYTKSITSSNYNNNQKKRRCNNTTSRISVFCIFFTCVLGAIATFFCWPRTPRVSLRGGASSVNGAAPDWGAGEKGILPSRPSLSGTWQINVTLDNRDNWIPTHIKSLDFVMMDSLTLAKFAWATFPMMILQPGIIAPPISVTFNVKYQAADNMDPTFQNLYRACATGEGQRPALNVLLKVYFHLFGITWTPIVTATPYTGGILCPIK